MAEYQYYQLVENIHPNTWYFIKNNDGSWCPVYAWIKQDVLMIGFEQATGNEILRGPLLLPHPSLGPFK